ncbi:hypothetical protein GCM10023220_16250 [Streptomyces ziwulingensis]|uniref:Uncharacterized protein n=1 Tax=Streptomyces ziwulingensis TaxID=1045501 RepID=A0ABP9BAK2_9ACTN
MGLTSSIPGRDGPRPTVTLPQRPGHDGPLLRAAIRRRSGGDRAAIRAAIRPNPAKLYYATKSLGGSVTAAEPADTALETVHRELTAFARRARAPAGRTHPELSLVPYTLLGHLEERDGRRATDLAAHYALDKSTVSRDAATGTPGPPLSAATYR